MKTRRKLVLLAMVSLLASSAALFSFSYAWFSTQRQQMVRMQAIQVQAPNFTFTSYECFAVSSLTKGPTTTSVTFVSTQIFDMPRYDPRYIDYSIYKKAIVVRITYEYTGTETIYMSAITETTTFTTGELGSGDTDNNFTSNAFQLTPNPGTTLTTGWTQASLTYTNADTRSFVTFSPSPVKTTSLTMDTIVPGDFVSWIVLEYYEPAMLYIGDVRGNNERVVIYADDINYRVE